MRKKESVKSGKYIYPVDITEYQEDLRKDSVDKDWSIHKVIRKILAAYYGVKNK